MDLSVDQLDDVMPSTLETCRTSVQFILTSISIAYEVKPKQAAALLANNHKVLQHLCIKGGKGSTFDQVLKWYVLVHHSAEHLVNLINTEKRDIMSYGAALPLASKGEKVNENRGKILFKTLNILKSGFYSRNPEVQMKCGELFIGLTTAVNNTPGDIVNEAWEWLVTSTQIPDFKRIPVKGVTINDAKSGIGSHLIQVSRNGEQDEITLSREMEQFQF